ncbi:MAG TPA: chemotaxis-specific protein-glutamate methyltransferase CheB [Candidatus Wallbacteria bacterium]|nr:chemotaxis-specific protein-glutamate methyltransferase CheB [Candidatus Wallbacteria bacterium]
MPPTKVLIVDSSVVNRRILINMLETDKDIQISGFAADAAIGLTKLALSVPDVVLVDIKISDMSGIEMLKKIKQANPKVSVIMLNNRDENNEKLIIEALNNGADDYATKPSSTLDTEHASKFIMEELIPKIKCYHSNNNNIKFDALAGSTKNDFIKTERKTKTPRVDIIAVGASTGGPKALEIFLRGFNGAIDVPILIVQHMPPKFTKHLADRLSFETKINVKEGSAGSLIEKGKALIAPGDYHMTVKREAATFKVDLNQGPLENSCRPAVDVLFRTAADIYGENVLSVILTGMGQDGLIGCNQIKRAGGQVIAQDKNTSVVWGMPGAVVNNGLADKVLPLEEIASEVMNRIRIGNSQ